VQGVRAYACQRTRLLFASLLQELCDSWQSAVFKDEVEPFHQVVVHVAPFLECQPPELFVDDVRQVGGLLLDARAFAAPGAIAPFWA
jgi:hypothetical protein